MSKLEGRIRWETAVSIADRIILDTFPYVQRQMIAGSIRRKARFVKDIELLCIPEPARREHDLVGLDITPKDAPDRLTRYLEQAPKWSKRLSVAGRPAFGKLNKLMHFQYDEGLPVVRVDVLSTTPEEWGWALMVRTGPKEWNIKVMQRWKELGYKGRITGGIESPNGERLVTETEEDVFRLLKWDYVSPEERR